jgi:HK97 family phage portal protein
MDWWGREWWGAILDWLRPVRTPAGAPPYPSSAGFPWWPGSGDAGATYAALYRTQPHVRTVVEFLASQLGQLGIQVFRRLSDTDRVRVSEHPLSRLLKSPNEGTTRYVFISEIIQDWAVYGNAYAVKLRRRNRLELYRVPPLYMRPVGDLIPRAYTWTLPNGEVLTLPASEVFHLREYNPEDPCVGLSRLETLRKLLAEEAAAVNYREWFWNNGAKLAGWIGRAKDAPRWTPEQRAEFRNEWSQFQGPRNAGKTAVLEDGMTFNPVTATARESELIAARKLSREEVAAAFHVPPAMLGIVESQGYGSLREQHKALYQDTLGPTVSLLEGEIERQLLVEFTDSEDVYVQMNIAEKLQGSFEEEQAALAAAVGSPYMTRNEARARLNLPRVNDPAFDVPVTRLDIAEGQNAKNAAAAAPPAPAPSASFVVLEGAQPAARPAPVDLDPLAERIERALRVLPAELAARLPAPATPTAVTRARRGADGRIVGFDEYGADGALIRHRALTRDAEGRVLDLEAVEDPAA